MNLDSETGLGNLLFEQNEEIRLLKGRLMRHEEAASVLAFFVHHTGPIIPTVALRVMLEDAHTFAQTGRRSMWMQSAIEVMRGEK
jgi:hypothetical protein